MTHPENFKIAEQKFNKELVRVYGENNAKNKRYLTKFDDAKLQASANAFVIAAREWQASMTQSFINSHKGA